MGGVGGSDEARATLIRDEWMRGCFVVCICLSVYVCVFSFVKNASLKHTADTAV